MEGAGTVWRVVLTDPLALIFYGDVGSMMTIVQAQSEEDMAHARELLREYANSLKEGGCFQGFQRELDGLPGDYAPPGGCLLIAKEGQQVAGCVALRKCAAGVGEMKRLYVRPAFRGKGIGRELAATVIDEALKIGYGLMRLDTLPSMQVAIALYRSLGFYPIESYQSHPIPGALYLELVLEQAERSSQR